MQNLGSSNSNAMTVSGPAIPRTSQGEPLLELRSLHGEERLCEIYAYTLELVTPSRSSASPDAAANIDLKQMIGNALTITLPLDETHTREISGLVFEARYLGQEGNNQEQKQEQRGRYEIIIKPWVALAAAHTDYRIFQNRTVNEIIDSVLEKYPFATEARLQEASPMMDFQVQYGETDIDFVQRLMREYGIYWFFEHRNGDHVMVRVDHPGAHRKVENEAGQTLSYCPPGQRADGQHIHEFAISQSWQPGLSKGLRASGRGPLRNMQCGTVFTLANYPQEEANRNYLVIAASITAKAQSDATDAQACFETTFEAQPDTEIFRPPRTIPKQHTAGPQAQLVGPGGKVTIDEAGITLEGRGIYLKAPVISMGDGQVAAQAPVTEADCPACHLRQQIPYTPVDVATGQHVLGSRDFSLPGRMTIEWSRRYRSADQRTGSLGVAWQLPWSTAVRREAAQMTWYDADGRGLHFPLLEPGQQHFHPIEKCTLCCNAGDAAGSLLYEIRFGNGVTEHYAPHPTDDTHWQLHRITDRDGNALDISYTSQGWLKSVDNHVHTVKCELDNAGRITAVYLEGDRPLKLASYTYDGNGDLVEAIDRAGRKWHYTYQRHLLASYRTPGGATFVSEWDGDTPQARVVRTYGYTDNKDAPAHEMRFVYDTANRITRRTDALGRVTEYHSNGLWAVDRTLYPDGSVTQTHFDPTGSISGQTDELGRTTHFVNDAWGNLTTVIDAAGNITRTRYNSLNLPGQITDAAGQTWQYTYDEAGHLLTETDPLGNITAYTYENGLPATRTDALGNVMKTAYNSSGQLVAVTDCSGHTTNYAYDNLGQPVSRTDALGCESRQQWSPAGQLTAMAPAGLGAWKMQYDEAGRPVARTDPLNQRTQVQWNAYDQRMQATDAAGSAQQYHYDVLGRLARITNAKGESATFGYDSRDRLVVQTGFDGRRQTWKYNAAGEITERTDHGADGQIITQIVNDALGHLVARSSSDGSQASYCYDARGLLTQAQASAPGNAPVQVTYEYDAAGRRTAEVQVHHGKVWRFAHELDAVGNRNSLRVPDAGTITWQRYGSGHVHGILLNGNALVNFERDKLHREILRVQGTVTHTLGYTAAGTLARHHWQEARAQAKLWRTWEYDWVGEVTQIQDAVRGEKRYSYDTLSRLTDAGDEHFTYDATCNLVEAGHEGWYGRATGNRLEVLVLGKHRVQYGYDGHGNRVTRTVGEQTMRHQYDAMHQLEAITLPDGTKAEYEYDALGRRVAKHVAHSNRRMETTLYVWDGDWLAQEISNGRIITYIQHPDHAGPLAKIEEGKVYHYVTDHLGTPQEMHTDNGKIVWAAEYGAYGRVRRYPVHEVSNPIRFAGQYLDEETGLHYNRFRYYDPQAGRYVSQDPAGLSGGMNTYAYVKGNPVHNTDPLGLVCNSQGCWNTPRERAYALSGDWKDYYATACAGGDSYACEGGNVASNTGLLPEILNARVGRMISAHLPAGQACATSRAIVEKKMDDIRMALAAARVAQLDLAGASPANPVAVSGQSIADFHNQIFQTIGGSSVSSWGIPVFGGDLPFSNFLAHWCAAPACYS